MHEYADHHDDGHDDVPDVPGDLGAPDGHGLHDHAHAEPAPVPEPVDAAAPDELLFADDPSPAVAGHDAAAAFPDDDAFGRFMAGPEPPEADLPAGALPDPGADELPSAEDLVDRFLGGAQG